MTAQVGRAPDPVRVLVRLSAQIVILSLLSIALSTWLWIGIPVYRGVAVGHIVVTALLAALAERVLALAPPLAGIVSSGVGGVERVGLTAAYLLRLAALTVVYFGFRWLFTLAFCSALGVGAGEAGVVYDALFLGAASYLVYALVRALTG